MDKIAVLWVGANAVIMGDPLHFATSGYSNESYVAASGEGRLAFEHSGDLPAPCCSSLRGPFLS